MNQLLAVAAVLLVPAALGFPGIALSQTDPGVRPGAVNGQPENSVSARHICSDCSSKKPASPPRGIESKMKARTTRQAQRESKPSKYPRHRGGAQVHP